MDRTTTILAAVIAFGASALISQIDHRDAATAPAADAAKPVAAGTSYSQLLADLDQRITSLQDIIDTRADDWLTRAHLATALLERAGLTGQLDDFARVQTILDEAFAIAHESSGPVLIAARFNYAIHRLGAAEAHLDKLARSHSRGNEAALARTLRAEIAAQRGQYAAAFAELSAVAAAVPAAAKAELALYHAKTGKPLEAAALLAELLAEAPTQDRRRRAWLQLQLGVVAMNRGELQLAMTHLKGADAEVSGWWLVQEHIAEVHNRHGNRTRAIEIFEELVRTADLPQHMDTLADHYRHLGETAKAEPLISRAAARWDQQLARFPEAAMGHALDHFLHFGPPERALELALANHAARPGGDAQVALAQAYLQSGRSSEALAVLEQALASPYRTARLHAVAARAHTAAGNTAAAEEQLALCYAINPWYTDNDHSH